MGLAPAAAEVKKGTGSLIMSTHWTAESGVSKAAWLQPGRGDYWVEEPSLPA
uniref:Uncharacterized protein n=1 Tax=Cucumis melo TaxID=3656 RepID=A0A9I9CGK7_CUCME